MNINADAICTRDGLQAVIKARNVHYGASMEWNHPGSRHKDEGVSIPDSLGGSLVHGFILHDVEAVAT